MIELIIAIMASVIVSAGCSLCEAVLYSVPLRHIETLVTSGNLSGKIFREFRRDVEKPITAILSLNTIANTAGAAVAGSAASVVFGHHRVIYFSIFFTVTILVLSEVIPKTAGVVYARKLVPWVALPLKGLVKIMGPVIWLCGHITGLIARGETQKSISSDELKTMARLSLRMGGIKQYQGSVIDNILSLETKKAKNVMTPRMVVFSLSEHLTLEDASGKSSAWEHSRFPVYDENSEDIVGIVLTREMFIALAKGKSQLRLTDLMRPVSFVAESASLNNVLMEFIASRDKLFVVIDEYGGLSGIITLEDIMEEILGHEIIDESDQVADKRKYARDKRISLISGDRSEV